MDRVLPCSNGNNDGETECVTIPSRHKEQHDECSKGGNAIELQEKDRI